MKSIDEKVKEEMKNVFSEMTHEIPIFTHKTMTYSISFWIVSGLITIYLGVLYLNMKDTIKLYKSFDKRITDLENKK